ncbi:hypothetical protein KEJ36_05610 [Candidatus Bathyarchaeota archaeon]|nr:hypothetical protein [Candidatus Bathyarchaeota archaeon]MBS7628257.1 hypothetical protein [Candidatus Bathyarchaeota archaeon]
MDVLKSEILELLDKDKEFRYAVAGYLGLSEILKRLGDLTDGQTKLREDFGKLYAQFSLRFEEHDRKFNEIALELKSLRKEVGGLGETLGVLVEDYIIEKFGDELRRRGLSLEEIRSLTVEGKEIDAVFRDNEAIVVEVKSVVRGEDIRDLARKQEIIERAFKRPTRAIIAGIRVDSAAENLAKDLRIEVLRRLPRKQIGPGTPLL